jgi:hypothetical protein
MEIVRQEAQSAHLCPRGHVATICIRAFKGRRDVLVHLFRPEWTSQDEEYCWSDLVQEDSGTAQTPGRGDSRAVLLESFTREEMEQIVDYLASRYADRLTRISVNSLDFPLPPGLLPLSSMPEGKDIGRIRFEIVPRYPLPFVVHGLYDLSQHKPMDQGLSQG